MYTRGDQSASNDKRHEVVERMVESVTGYDDGLAMRGAVESACVVSRLAKRSEDDAGKDWKAMRLNVELVSEMVMSAET
jgi:hypothetical protein